MRGFFSTRKGRLSAVSGTGVLLLAGVLCLANLLSRRFFVRLDWSAGGRYSLSGASKKLVRSLPDPVILRAYVSEGLPQPYASQAQYVVDLLNEFRTAARGKVAVEVLNPEGSEKVKADARKAGVIPARFTQMASDQFQVREGYMGLTIFYQDKQEVLPFIKGTEGLEYDVSSRLKKMSQKEKKRLGVVNGHGEKFPDDLRRGAAARLFDDFQVEPVELSTRTALNADLIFIIAPAVEFKPEEVAVLDAAASSGVPVALFLSQRSVNFQNFSAFPRPRGLDAWLAHYGVRIGGDFVLDAQCQQVQLQSRQGGYTIANIISYPAFALSKPGGSHPFTRSLDALGFPFAHPVIPAPAPGLTVIPLARSSPQSWMPPDLYSLDPYGIRPPAPTDPKGPFTLAVTVEGTTNSFSDPSRAARVRMAVIGTGYFADDGLPLPPANAEFIAGLAGWMAQDADFLAIPSRGPSFHPLRRLPDAARYAAKLAGYFLLPVLTVLWGFDRWRRRRARRPRIQKEWMEAARG